MLPYVTQPSFAIGPITIYAFGMLVACGLLAGYAVTVQRAVRRGVDRFHARLIALLVAVTAVAGSALLSVLLLRAPGIYSFGGIYIGLATAYALSHFLLPAGQALIMVDAFSFAFPVGWIFGRFGCTLAHDHPGIPSRQWFAVQYPEGSRLDLGLIEFVFTCLLVAFLLWLDRRPHNPGFYLGVFMLVYGPFRLALEQFRPLDAGGFSVHIAFAAASFLLGAFIFAGQCFIRPECGGA